MDMKLLNKASYNSARRGYDYSKSNRVSSIIKNSNVSYEGLVKGSRDEPYHVHINIDQIKQSKCDCPFTEGNQRICKHMIALMFAVFPEQLKHYESDVIEEEDRYEEYIKERESKLYKFIDKLKKQELRNILIEVLESGPEWQYDRFINDYIEFYEDIDEDNDLIDYGDIDRY